MTTALPKCFWCGRPRSVALPGRLYKVADYVPCQSCAAAFRAGIWIVETRDASDADRPPIVAGATPTGRWLVVTREAMERWRDSPHAAGWEQRALDVGRVLMDRVAYEALIGKGADDGRPH